MTSIFRRHSRGRPPYPDVLTPAEWRVLEEIRDGRSNPEIAERLGLSRNTVKTHISSMLGKLDLRDRDQLAAWRGKPMVARARRSFVLAPFGWLTAKAVGVVAVTAVVGALLIGFAVAMDSGRLTGGGSEALTLDDAPVERPEVGELLMLSSQAMANEEFLYQHDDDLVAIQYTPGRNILQWNSPRTDNFRHILVLDDEAYVSDNGERWLAVGDAPYIATLLVSDPRVQLEVAMGERFEADEHVQGHETFVVVARMDIDVFISQVWPSDDPGSSAGPFLDGMEVRFWIDQRDHLVRRLQWTRPGSDPAQLEFDYEALVDIPTSVISMTQSEARELSQQGEQAGAVLLEAIASYREQRDQVPPSLDPGTLSDVLPAAAWPINPFSNAPMQESRAPGDFDYVITGGGTGFELTVSGWDGDLLYFDSDRLP